MGLIFLEKMTEFACGYRRSISSGPFFLSQFLESVCPVIRPEFMQFKPSFVYTVFKPDRKIMGPLPETFKLTVTLMTAYGLCQTLNMEKESQI